MAYNPPSPFAVIDRQVCAALLLLLFFGVMALFSLSYIARDTFSAGYFQRHLRYVVTAAVLFALCLRIPLEFWREKIIQIALIALVLCFAALAFEQVKGASRWIRIGGMTVQPAEFLKFAALLACAVWGEAAVKNHGLKSANFRQTLFSLRWLAPFLALALGTMYWQKDLGTTVILVLIALLAMFLAGIRLRYVFIVGALAAALFAAMVISSDNRIDRIMAFIDPFADPFNKGQAQLESLTAYTNGGWWGAGAGGGMQKELLLEAHNDFIIAVIAEEYGLVGFFVVCAAYVFIVTRGFSIARRAGARGEIFGALYAYGLAALVLAQVTIHVGGSLAALPSKGLTLPLVSYGGSSLWATALMLAALLRIDYENKIFAAGRP